MTGIDGDDGRLFALYTRYVGEPQSKSDVYGYWAFIGGVVVALTGVVVFVFGPTSGSELNYAARELAISLAALGLALVLLGIVLQLPVKRLGVYISLGGVVVAGVGVVWFIWVYPNHWSVGSPDYSDEVIGIYTFGLTIVAGVAALIPLLTGERSLFFESERERTRDYPESMVGESTQGGVFAVYEDGKQWTWRLLEQEALAGSPNTFLSRLEAEERVEAVKDRVSAAGLLEINHAAFRLYQAEADRWRWLLMRKDGEVVADSGHEFPRREDASESISNLKERGPAAETFIIDEAAFEVVGDGGRWRWQLVDPDHSVLAQSAGRFDSSQAAEDAMGRVRGHLEAARVLTVEQYGVELYEEADSWHWQLLDGAEDTIASNASAFQSKRNAESTVYDVLEALDDAPLIDAGTPAYELTPSRSGGWTWRLAENGEILASSHEARESESMAEYAARRFKQTVGTADSFVMDGAAFECYTADSQWHWRLVTEHRTVLAHSTSSYESRRAAEAGIDAVRTHAASAERMEFDNEAFQLYQSGEEWRWRLIDGDGIVMADSGDGYESKQHAAESMTDVKETAPGADLLQIETPAFELYSEAPGTWNWRLVDASGTTHASGSNDYESKATANGAMETMKRCADSSDTRTMERAAFQLYADDTEDWRWRYVHQDGTILADGVDAHATRDATSSVVETLREQASGRAIHAIDHSAIQLRPRDGTWRWEVVDTERTPVVTGQTRHDSEADVRALIERLKRHAMATSVFELREPVVYLARDDGSWDWQLLDAEKEPLAESPEQYQNETEATDAIERVQTLSPAAAHVDFVDAAFECYEDDEEWRWRLIGEDRSVVAESTDAYASRVAVMDAIDAIKAEVGDASILEIDTAAFELYRDGEAWRWRLIDEDGNALAESSVSYPTRTEARDGMSSVKEFGPHSMTEIAE